ncbi:nucleotidyltransferase family protein [Roseobacter sp. S98]|uniref:nucleotidyltransferase family protein n=1 Tax=Roseobacter algicola (ex Choi et al. 2025) (nom. illeg.) TaxID=3092138 RepID=UPI0035C6CBF5
MSLPVMLFAAGFGTRMRPLTDRMPKPMIPVGGRPLVDYAVDLAQAIDPPAIVANLHYRPDELRTHLTGRGVQTITETPEILDTGGGLRNALPLLGSGPVITVNSDAIWSGPNPLNILLQAWDPAKMDALLLCVPEPNARGSASNGDFISDEDGLLKRGPGDIYSGAQIINPDLLATVSGTAFSLNRVWDHILVHQRLYGVRYNGTWCDVGHPDGIPIAEDLLDQANV